MSFIFNAKPFGDMPCIIALDTSRGQEALKYRGDELTFQKDLFRKTVVIKTTSLKPAEYSVLSEDKSIRADETFPHSADSLSRIEKVLRHHRKAVSLIQWLVVLLYFSLLLLPALSGNFIDERVYDSISDFSRLIFWGDRVAPDRFEHDGLRTNLVRPFLSRWDTD